MGTVSAVEVRWWVRSDFDAADTAAAWMRLARKHLPEALPIGRTVLANCRASVKANQREPGCCLTSVDLGRYIDLGL